MKKKIIFISLIVLLLSGCQSTNRYFKDLLSHWNVPIDGFGNVVSMTSKDPSFLGDGVSYMIFDDEETKNKVLEVLSNSSRLIGIVEETKHFTDGTKNLEGWLRDEPEVIKLKEEFDTFDLLVLNEEPDDYLIVMTKKGESKFALIWIHT